VDISTISSAEFAQAVAETVSAELVELEYGDAHVETMKRLSVKYPLVQVLASNMSAIHNEMGQGNDSQLALELERFEGMLLLMQIISHIADKREALGSE
jgi:hypothetical protein